MSTAKQKLIDGEFFGFIRDIGVEVEHIRQSFQEIAEKNLIVDPTVREIEVKAATTRATAIYEKNQEAVTQLLDDARKLCREHVQVADWWGDEVTRIENEWQRAELELKPVKSCTKAVVTLQTVANTDKWYHSIIYRCAELTVPDRVDQHLQTIPPGQELDFHANFREAVPNEEHRVKLLKFMQDHPNCLWGVVNVDTGKILSLPRGVLRRIRTYVWVGLWLAACIGLAYELPRLGKDWNINSWPIKEVSEGLPLFGVYLFALAGAIGHIFLDVVKQFRQGTVFRTVSDVLSWVHVNELNILISIGTIFLASIVVYSSMNSVTLYFALLAGYSADSIVDTWLQRFEKSVVEQTEGLTKMVFK
ncbi:MAG: hypothetical protein KDA88_01270 [Planctomycetaceae bacterium]|nr:hypothetical protein [Planctomycetaceae bacterium]